jgi:hypothetical protein
LTPTKVKLVTECVANNSTVGLGVAADFQIADKIIQNGGEATLGHLAKVCNTDEHKLGECCVDVQVLNCQSDKYRPQDV